jgi:hypothetical protein
MSSEIEFIFTSIWKDLYHPSAEIIRRTLVKNVFTSRLQLKLISENHLEAMFGGSSSQLSIKKHYYFIKEMKYVFTCFHALMKTSVRLGEFSSRSKHSTTSRVWTDLHENMENILHFLKNMSIRNFRLELVKPLQIGREYCILLIKPLDVKSHVFQLVWQ